MSFSIIGLTVVLTLLFLRETMSLYGLIPELNPVPPPTSRSRLTSPSYARREWNRDGGFHVWTERLRSDVPRRGGAGTSRTEPKEMEAGGPQRVAAWVDAQGARTRRGASLPKS